MAASEIPPDEIPGDFFDRQRRVPGWDHTDIAAQTAFVLGTGGIGSAIAMALCRLGIKKLYLLDRDFVEASNLNRQLLFCKADIGRRKVDAAVDGLRPHSLQTVIVAVHSDAVDAWADVVAIARTCTVLFNGIDHGPLFDYAVSSLSVALGIPYITGSSYGHTSIVEAFSGRPGLPCWACNNAPAGFDDVLDKLAPNMILEHKALPFINSLMPLGLSARLVGSSVLPCTIASMLAVDCWLNGKFGHPVPNWGLLNLSDVTVVGFAVEADPRCKLCSMAPKDARQLA